MQNSKLHVHEIPQAKSDDETHFDKSLQELRDLCSQLHYAADCCEATFLNAKHKKIILKNTKEYLCRAVVTVVDHIGCVSDNLDNRISKNNAVSETELRVDCLNQRLSTCQQYSHNLALTKIHLNADLPRYHPRYLSPHIQRSHAVLRESGLRTAAKDTNKHEFETQEEVPLLVLVEDSKNDIGAKKSDSRSAPVLPVRGDPFTLPRAHSFHFEEKRKLKRNMLHWKSAFIKRGKGLIGRELGVVSEREPLAFSLQNKELISLIRWGKRI